MKVVVFRGEDGWRYRIVARNGRKLCVSEAYSSAYAAKRAAYAFLAAAWTLHLLVEVEAS